MERVSVISNKPFDTVAAAVRAGVDRLDLAAFSKASKSAGSFTDLEYVPASPHSTRCATPVFVLVVLSPYKASAVLVISAYNSPVVWDSVPWLWASGRNWRNYKGLGAHTYIDTKAENAAEALKRLGGADAILATAPNGGAMASLIDGVAVRGKLIVVGVANDPMPVSTLSLDSEVLVGPRDWDPKAGSGTEKETRALGLREYPHRSHPTHAVRGDCVFTNIGILLWPWRA